MKRVTGKPRMVVVSHVLPFPGTAGQQQRVLYTLEAARTRFHVTFLTTVRASDCERVERELSGLCDDVIVLPSRYTDHPLSRVWHRVVGALYCLRTGLKFSNYLLGRVEFTPRRISEVLQSRAFDCALFEYWHATDGTEAFRASGIPCVLDMHDILWQAFRRQLDDRPALPAWWRNRIFRQYREAEEQSWCRYEAVIAINREEQAYVVPRVPEATRVLYAPMGIDLERWPFGWKPAQPPRLAYYGGLASAHNQQAALRCYREVMCEVWRVAPDAEYWIVGSNPPASLEALAVDPRVKITGFVRDVGEVLRTMTAVVCPWQGRYGFRSRLVEVMGLGVPVVASPDAVYGMELQDGDGLLLGETTAELAGHAVRLIEDLPFAQAQSRRARDQVERLYSQEDTYGRLMAELSDWACAAPGVVCGS